MQKTNNLKLYQFIVDCGGIKFTELEYQTEDKQNKVCHTLVLTALRYKPAFTDVVEGSPTTKKTRVGIGAGYI